MRRKGLKHINVGESLTFQIGDWNKNSFNKIQFSGFINESCSVQYSARFAIHIQEGLYILITTFSNLCQ